MDETIKRKWRACSLRTFWTVGTCVSSAAILAALLREHWSLSYGITGTMISTMVAGNILSAFVSGMLPAYLGERKTHLLFSLGLTAGCLMLAFTGQPWLLCAGFFLIGMAKGATMNIAPMLAKRAASDLVRHNNLMHSWYAIGGLSCPLLIGLFSRGSWRMPMFALAGVGVIHILSFAVAGLPDDPVPKTARHGAWDFLHSRFFWLLTAALFCQCASEQTVTNWVVSYFKDCGILTGFLSDLSVTVVWAAMLVARLGIVYLLRIRDNFKALAVMSAGSFGAYLLLLSCKNGVAALSALFVFGMFIAGTNPLLIASSGEQMSLEELGVLIPVGSLGAVVMPWLVGEVAEAAGMAAGMICPLVSMLAMLALVLACRKAQAS